MTTLVLLNQCLRLKDNPLLTAATGDVCAVVALNKATFFGQQYGIFRANLARLRQQTALITDLKQRLAQHNIGLVTLFGHTTSELQTLAQQLNARMLIAAEPTATEEYGQFRQLAQTLKITLIDCNSLLAASLRPALATFPDRFTTFRKQLEPLLRVSPPAPDFRLTNKQQWLGVTQAETLSQSWQQLAEFSEQNSVNTAALDLVKHSETASWQRLEQFIWQKQHILHYKDTRNALIGDNYASFFSAPLAVGTLSARSVWQQIEAFEQKVAANDSTYWLKFELLWREFFRWQFRKYQAAWFSAQGIKGTKHFTPPKLNQQNLQRFVQWCQGQTGVPFVDANMRLLNQTGLMSNRGRQNVASYLIHDLALDWRLGAAYFEQRLLDYDVASNWGNWAYIAGYGNSEARPFSLIKQAISYDPEASFVRQLLPELSTKGKTAHRPAAGSILAALNRNWLAELDK
ncbi:DASH family cryptochrome [Alishewanella sp. d11]|uniref:DASH family cryptochrome n=1 Tax=Alishewanella sp. d11 TaxID=3414030 RepID=UPI003BF911FE